ncbi:putative phosphatase [Zhongshania aliphaticivorans]|uniref:Putative phosphatase n=1 Tax=Zhongshania aliphaticivorans TaxID=1470434 RepID=A0A5S9NCD3_9GAMM|nr:HAD family hydrolase [Zhongshania aliphaticivorans]CAA0079943.1 putative phosphatase [Zhongshania aliphaticivorans]CAA0085956.1 putative phosphatase [Zhongshania aliphaticivorans]
MALAIFDLDNTLLGGDSDHAWGEFLVAKGIVNSEEFKTKNDEFYRQYQQGGLDINAYLRFALQPLSKYDSDTLNAMHATFMDEYIAPLRLPKADALLQKHRDEGDFVMIITATNSFITRPIADALGVETLLACDGEIINGRYTGEPAGIPCYQEGKVTRLHNWLQETGHSLDGSYFYSDSHNDLPLLKVVDHAVAVDPDDTLKAAAHDAGWPIISLR